MSVTSEYLLEISDSIQNVDQDAWQRLCPAKADVFMNPGLLAAVESSMASDASFWYILFRDSQNNPVAAATISTYIIDSTVLAVGIGAKMAKVVSKVIPSLTRTKILFLGMPFSSGQSHVRLAPHADRNIIVRQVAELLESKAKETKAEIIVAKEFQESELEWASGLEKYGYRRADSLPMNYMTTEFDDFDSYLEHLRSKKRCELRRVRNKLNHRDVTIVNCHGEEAARRLDDRAHALYENMLFRSQTRSEHLPREFFVEIARQMPQAAEFHFVYEGDLLVAFGCCVHSETCYCPLYGGLDYERNAKYDLYSNLLFEGVNLGLKSGRPELWVGANADELKHRKLGTYQEPRYLFVRGGWWLAKLILKAAFNLFFPRHEVLYPREQPPAVGKVA